MDPSNAADQWVATGTGILEAPANEAEEIQEIQEIQVFRKEDVHQEYFFDPWAYVAINGKTYGKAVNCSLIFDTLTAPTTRLILDCREKFFKSEIAIEGIIERDMSPKYNPEGSRYYHFSVNITGRDIFNWTVQPPNSYTLPAYFNPLSDWVSDEKCLVSFDVGPVRIFNSAVPKLLDSKAEADLKEFFHDIREAKLQNKPFHFEIITLYFAEEGETYDSVMKLMEDKINNDKAVDPTLYWIKNSPNAHMLRQENIFAPRERPALSVENLVRKLRRTQPSHLDLKVHAVYCEVDEWLYERGLAAEIAAVKFMVTFEEVPGSAFMINRNDNKLPKMYISSIRWDNKKMERPRLGDSFVMVMPFKVPDPPKCLDGPKKQRPPPPRDDRDEDDVVDHGDYITVRESRAEYFERSEQARMDDLEVKRTLWHARLLESSELNAPGQPLMKVFRPKEPKWEGLHDAPTVGTVIPATETRIRSLARRRQYIAKDAPRHAVYIKKTLSDQTYKDTLRGLNELFEKYKEDLSQTVLRHHLVGYLTDGNVDAVFPPLDFFSTCVPDYKRFAANLTKYQRDRFFQAAQVQHGVMLVEGGAASGKTRLVLSYGLAHAANFKAANQLIVTTDTNQLVNELMDRIKGMASTYAVDGIRIVRVHSLPAEDSRFIHQHVPGKRACSFFQDHISTDWLVQNLLDDIGKQAQDKATAGDTRFDAKISDLSLNQAMIQEIKANPGRWEVLIRKMRSLSLSSDGSSASEAVLKEVNALVAELRRKILRDAHIIGITCDLLLRKEVCDAVAPTMLIKDEDPRSRRTKFMAIIGLLPTLKVVVLAGDTRQKGPFMNTDKADVPATFAKFGMYTAFQFFKDSGLGVISLYEQHRMFNAPYVDFISRHYYNDALVDGNATRPRPAQVGFCKNLMKQLFQVNNNYAFIVCNKTRAEKEEGGVSLTNLLIQHHLLQKLIVLKGLLDCGSEATLGFKPESFTVAVISSYLGVVNWMKMMIHKHLDKRFTAHVFEVVQGLEKDLVFRVNPNTRLTPFAGAAKDNLVADTRWRYGYCILATSESLDSNTYGKPTEYYMTVSPTTRNVYGQYQFACIVDSMREVDLDADAGVECRKCGGYGHEADNESCPFHGRASCFNCGAFGHTHDKCKDPIISAAPAQGKGKRGCFHCHGDHDKIDCPHPWDDTVETGMLEKVAQEPVNWDTTGVKDTSFGW